MKEMPWESRRRSGNGFCPGERGKTSNCLSSGLWSVRNVWYQRTRVRKDKNWVEETCEKEDFQEKCLGWKSLPRFANFPGIQVPSPSPEKQGRPQRPTESQDWSVRSSTPAIARGAPCPSSREETRGFRILGGPRIISPASPPRRGLGTQKRNKESTGHSVDLGPRPLSCSLRVTLRSCELRSSGEEGEDSRNIVRQPCFT